MKIHITFVNGKQKVYYPNQQTEDYEVRNDFQEKKIVTLKTDDPEGLIYVNSQNIIDFYITK